MPSHPAPAGTCARGRPALVAAGRAQEGRDEGCCRLGVHGLHDANCYGTVGLVPSHFKSAFFNLRDDRGERHAGFSHVWPATGSSAGRSRSPYLVSAHAHHGTLFAFLCRRGGVSMPRKTIKIPDHIEYLSILDEHGRVDTKLMPDLPADELRHMHRVMLLSRRF